MKYTPSYNFSNDGVDWDEYSKEVRIRTDALWERGKLKDYFRLFYKIFHWDPKSKEYYIATPLHSNYNAPDEWRFKIFRGYNPTGKTNSYQQGGGVEYASRTVSIAATDTLRDKNILCYYRFRSFKKCEGNTSLMRLKEERGEGNDVKNDVIAEDIDVGCYSEMLEMMDHCSVA